MKNTIKGGKADKMSVEDIAKKFNVSVDRIKAQIKKGVEIEKEHTNDEEKATEIAMDHVTEFPDYYDRIEKMEKDAKEKWEVNETKTMIKRLIRENMNNPKMLSALLGQVRNLLEYIEPRLQKYLKDGEKKNIWLKKIDNFKRLYLEIIKP